VTAEHAWSKPTVAAEQMLMKGVYFEYLFGVVGWPVRNLRLLKNKIRVKVKKLYGGWNKFYTPLQPPCASNLTDTGKQCLCNTNGNVSQLDISMENGMGRHTTKGIDSDDL
jgi:hypothetical protein